MTIPDLIELYQNICDRLHETQQTATELTSELKEIRKLLTNAIPTKDPK